jgi:hypothetical protein
MRTAASPDGRRPSREPRNFGLLGIVAWCAAAVVAVVLYPTTSAAAAIVVSFMLLAPGLALILVLRLGDVALGATIVLLTGIATGVLVPASLLYAHAWSPRAAFAIVVAATLVVVLTGIVLRRTERAGQ